MNICETCGDEFAAQRADARHCSNACRQKGYRQRSHRSDGVATLAKAIVRPQSDLAGHRGAVVLELLRKYPPAPFSPNPKAAADLMAEFATDAIYEAARATEGRLPAGAEDIVRMAVSSAIRDVVEVVWSMAWTEALENEPLDTPKPSRATGGLIPHVLDLVERLTKRAPEGFVKRVSSEDRDEVSGQLNSLSCAGERLSTWADHASTALTETDHL